MNVALSSELNINCINTPVITREGMAAVMLVEQFVRDERQTLQKEDTDFSVAVSSQYCSKNL